MSGLVILVCRRQYLSRSFSWLFSLGQVARVLSNTNFASTFAWIIACPQIVPMTRSRVWGRVFGRMTYTSRMVFQVCLVACRVGSKKAQVGTPYYLSPEICEEKPYNELSDALALNSERNCGLRLKSLGSKSTTSRQFYWVPRLFEGNPRGNNRKPRGNREQTNKAGVLDAKVWAFGCVVYEMCTLRL